MKRALILATGTYADSRIAALKSPVPDAERLRLLLTRQDVGPYEVTMLSDAGLVAQRVAIERYFQSAAADDTLLLFISGHGDKDADGDLYFLAQDTDRDLLSATAVGAHFVSRQAARSRAKQKVLLIDTCYSGAFAKGHVFKSGAATISAEDFGDSSARGTAIITAASSTQLASEAAAGGRMQSRFTRHMIEGIETGAADPHGTGSITLDDLFDYVRAALRREGPGQEPKRLNAIDGDMVIARNPVRRAVPLASALQKRVTSRNWETRAAACITLGEIVRGAGEARDPALAALRALAADPDDRVRRRAAAELGHVEPGEKEQPEKADYKPDPVPIGLLTKPTADLDGAATDDDAKPPKPPLDNVAKMFIAGFVALLLVMIAAFVIPDKKDDPVDPGEPSTTTGWQATSTAFPDLAATCNGGTDLAAGNACNDLGIKYNTGEGETLNKPEAVKLYNRACSYGQQAGCVNAGMLLAAGDGGVVADPAASYTLLKSACDAGNSAGCSELGYNTEFAIGTEANLGEASRLYTQECDKNLAQACYYLGGLYASGKMGPAETWPNVIYDARSKACSLTNNKFSYCGTLVSPSEAAASTATSSLFTPPAPAP